MTTVAVIGPGRVGTLLATACARAGYRVVAVGGGAAASRDRVVALVAGIRPSETPADAAAGAELILLAVPDDALEAVVTDLAVAGAVGDGKRVVHVAGSRGLDVLQRAGLAGARIAACHPAMTVPAGSTDPDVLIGTAWAVTAAPADRGWAHDLVSALGGDAHDVPDAARTLYHAGLVVGSNAVGAAVAVARQLLLAARIEDPAAFLDPLIRASVRNVLAEGASALTGPVVRGDVGTVERHLAVLDLDLPELAEAYRALGGVILDRVRAALPTESATALDRLLSASED
jgi:predicted short-subunit dehydrogenase-like oxidoreductase (DUF2520 family)